MTKLRSMIVLALALICAGPAFAQVTPGTSPLTGAKGGTNNAFMQFTGPATSLKTFTLPNASDTIATLAATQTLTSKAINCANNNCTVRLAFDITGFGNSVAPALGVGVGTPGAFVVNGGALGTPSSANLAPATGLPITTGVSGHTAASWTPTVTTTGTVGTPAYSVQVGSYEQIGRQVTVRFNITLSGWAGSPTGNVLIAGLPLTSANTANDDGVCHISNYVVTGLTASTIMTGFIAPNAASAQLVQVGTTTTTPVTTAQSGLTPTFIGMCNYHT